MGVHEASDGPSYRDTDKIRWIATIIDAMSPTAWRAFALAAGIAVGLLIPLMRGERAATPAETGTPAPAASGAIRFTDVTAESGVTFKHENGLTGRFRYPETMGAGVALFDYDGDGDLDLYLVNGNRLVGPLDPEVTSRLYRNEGGFRFTDVTRLSGAGVAAYGQGVCVGDPDGDGRLDLYVTTLNGGRYLHNRGDGTFESREKAVGLEGEGWGQSCAFFDYDGDSDLDLYVLKYLKYSVDMPQDERVVREGRKVPDYIGPWAFAGEPSHLYRNRGDGTFEDVTGAAGLFEPAGKGMGLNAVDFDGDHRTDIYQGNDGVPNFLFRNLGNGRFEEIALPVGAAVGYDGAAKASMGSDVGDFDNDGDLDVTVPAIRPYFQLRNDGAYFTDVTEDSGIAEITGRLTGFGANVADYDADGDLDIFFANGEVQSHELAPISADYHTRYGTADSVLANDGTGVFTDVSAAAGPHFQRHLIGRGSAAGDIDDDGDIDLVISNTAAPAVLLRNDSPRGRWLQIVLHDRGTNWQAIGAKVWVTSGGRTQYRELHGGGAYLSANDRRMHFGLGSATIVETIEVRWPDGERETRTNVPADQRLRIERAASPASASP
jgi:hypothetical protein